MFLCDETPSPLDRAHTTGLLARLEQSINSWSADNRFIFIMKLENVSSLTIKRDLERLFGLFLSVEAVDVRFFRLRAALREQSPAGRAND